MADLRAQFEVAAREVQNLPRRPDNDTMLRLYGLYKQATAGDVAGKRPGFTDPVGRAKYDAWSRLQNMPVESAMQQYVDLVESLKRDRA